MKENIDQKINVIFVLTQYQNEILLALLTNTNRSRLNII